MRRAFDTARQVGDTSAVMDLSTVLVALIAPAALALNQFMSDRKAVRLRQVEADAAEAAARQRSEEKALAERREAYACVLSAVAKYRAASEEAMTHLKQWASDSDTSSLTTSRLWTSYDAPALTFPTAEFAAANDAVALARLWAPSVSTHWVSNFGDVLRYSAACNVASAMTAQEAWNRWENLGLAVDTFARGAESDLEAQRSNSPAIESGK